MPALPVSHAESRNKFIADYVSGYRIKENSRAEFS
jgi:hypothetical protein